MNGLKRNAIHPAPGNLARRSVSPPLGESKVVGAGPRIGVLPVITPLFAGVFLATNGTGNRDLVGRRRGCHPVWPENSIRRIPSSTKGLHLRPKLRDLRVGECPENFTDQTGDNKIVDTAHTSGAPAVHD